MKVYKKRKAKNKFKQFTIRLVLNALVLIGMLASLNLGIEYVKTIRIHKEVLIIIGEKIDGALVGRLGDEGENLSSSSQVKPSGEEGHSPSEPTGFKEIVQIIFRLESSGGRNVNCPEGKFNGYGYRQNTKEWVCYDTQEEIDLIVEADIKHKLETYDLPTALCGYNMGFQHKDFQMCLDQKKEYPYYRDYLIIKNQ